MESLKSRNVLDTDLETPIISEIHAWKDSPEFRGLEYVLKESLIRE